MQESTISTYFENDTGRLFYSPTPDFGVELRGEPSDPMVKAAHSPLHCSYPLELIRLIFESYGAAHTCEEISRDIDETEASLDVRYSYLAYFSDVDSGGMRILDYGCGAGSSTMTLARLFPEESVITGVDLMPALLEIARARARHYGFENLSFVETLGYGEHEAREKQFDLTFLNAVYEHLLPDERRPVLASIWASLKPGGSLIINQTPHRWFPIETHTSGLPLVNYAPDALAHWMVRRYSRRSVRMANWNQLLRAGIRGGSVTEIYRILRSIDRSAMIRKPVQISKTWAGIWYAAKRERLGQMQRFKRAVRLSASIVESTRLPFSPYLNIAFTKPEH